MNHWSFYQIFNIKPPRHTRKAPPHERKAPLVKTFWRRFFDVSITFTSETTTQDRASFFSKLVEQTNHSTLTLV